MCRVKVTPADRAGGEAGSCFRCAIALALQRATGDDQAHVYEDLDGMYAQVHSRHIRVDHRVRQFVWEFDRLPRRVGLGNTVVLPHPIPRELRCFSFSLPAFNDPQWLERCDWCEEKRPPGELDDAGICEECRKDT